MKKSLFRQLLIAGTAFLLSAAMAVPAFAEEQKIGPGYEEEINDYDVKPSSPEEMAAWLKAREEKAHADSEKKETEAALETETAAAETAKPGTSLGIFDISGYCGCKRCSGGYNLTYSGTVPQAKHTISADLEKFPLGTKLYIDGTVYTVEDKGGNVLGNRLDIFFATHEEALDFGMKELEVFTVLE